MENLSGNMEKNVAGTAAAYSKKRKHWRVLLVGGNGRVFTVSLFQTMLIVLLLVLLAASAGVVASGLFFKQGLMDGSAAEREAKDLVQQNQSLRDEVDILMAKLVLMESRSDEKKSMAKTAKPDGSAGLSPNSKALSVPEAAKPAGQPPENASGPDKADEKKGSGIEIRDLGVDYDSDDGSLRVRFVIQDTAQTQTTLSGYCFAVLKGNENDPGQWLAIPETALADGKPVAPDKGQSFKISRYKSMALKAKGQRTPERFTKAVILLFSQDGRMIHEQEIPISIKMKRRK